MQLHNAGGGSHINGQQAAIPAVACPRICSQQKQQHQLRSQQSTVLPQEVHMLGSSQFHTIIEGFGLMSIHQV